MPCSRLTLLNTSDESKKMSGGSWQKLSRILLQTIAGQCEKPPKSPRLTDRERAERKFLESASRADAKLSAPADRLRMKLVDF